MSQRPGFPVKLSQTGASGPSTAKPSASAAPVRVASTVPTPTSMLLPRTASALSGLGLDSGAEQNLLSKSTSGKFLKENFDIRRRIKLKGTGGESVEVLSGMLKNARLDSLPLQPMATVLTNTSHINAAYETIMDGIVGYEFLSQYPMSINLKQRKLTIYRRVTP